MAFKVVWTPKADESFEKIILYLEKNWTEQEIVKFVTKTDHCSIGFLKIKLSCCCFGMEGKTLRSWMKFLNEISPVKKQIPFVRYSFLPPPGKWMMKN